MAKQSITERVRARMNQKAQEAKNKKADSIEWYPPEGTSRIRILPPIDDENPYFYTTPSYHYIPDDITTIGQKNCKGKYLWTKSQYEVAVGNRTVTKRDPIDEAVEEWYKVGNETNDKEMKALAGALKRKHKYMFNIILITKNEDTGETNYEYRILVDSSNKGELARIICRKMGIAFFRDIDSGWVEKDSDKFDEDEVFYDLIDVDEGHDFKIIKKKTGDNNWDISYEDSIVVAKPRSLSDEERELMEGMKDLSTYIAYEQDYNVVKATLDNLVGGDEDASDEDEVPAKKSEEKSTSNKPKKVVAEDNEDEDEEVTVKIAKKAAVKEEAPTKKSKGYSKPSKTEVNEDELDDMLDELDDEDDED